MRLSVIVAVHNGQATLERCLDAIVRQTRLPDEIIVVDDASAEPVEGAAHAHGARVVTLTGNKRGPAYARNRGVQAAQGDVVMFVDADVALHPDALGLAEKALSDDPTLAACFGSYDATPSAQGLVSQYRNLLHHYVHQHAREEATTFWAGCGAIRKAALEAVGGFCEQYRRPSVEDIDLGMRLHKAGFQVRLLRDMQGTHLKSWTFWNMLVVDIRSRAAPWTRVLLEQGALPNDLNLTVSSRWSAACALLLLAALAAGAFWPWAWLGTLPLTAGLLFLNADLYRFFVRIRGWGFCAGAVFLHWLYYVYSALTFGVLAVRWWLAAHALPILLVATLVKGLVWSMLVPLWRAPDERYHFLYAQQIERFGTLIVEPSDWVPKEAVKLWQLMEDEQLRKRNVTPAALARMADELASLDSSRTKSIYVNGRGQGMGGGQFNSFHPPLYYALVAAVQWPLEGAPITVRAWASRLVSVLLGVVVAWLAYATGLELWPGRRGRALLLGVLVSFHPHLTFLTSVVTNMALEIALVSATTLLSLQLVRRGMTVRRGLILGLVLGAGLLSKVSYLAVAPLVGIALGWHVWQALRGRVAWARLWPWLLAATIPLVMAGWWYLRAVPSPSVVLYGDEVVLAESAEIRPLSFLLSYNWDTRYRPMLMAYWSFAPNSILRLLTALFAVALWSLGWYIIRLAVRKRQGDRSALGHLLMMGLPTLGVVAFFTYLDYDLAQVKAVYILQGRYYVTPIVSQMVCLCVGIIVSAPRRLRAAVAQALGVGMVALNGYVLLGPLMQRYYGAGALVGQLERAARLHPVGSGPSLVACVLLAFLSALLLPTLWSKADWIEDLPVVMHH